MSEPKNEFDLLVETITQITTTVVASKRCSPAEGANMAREIINESMRVAREMTRERELSKDPRAEGIAMVQQRAAQQRV